MNGPLTGYEGEQRGQEKWGKGAEVALSWNCLMEATCQTLNPETLSLEVRKLEAVPPTKLSKTFRSMIGLYTHFYD